VKLGTVSRFILKCLLPFRFWIVGQFLVAFIWAVNLSLSPYVMKVILDRIPGLSPEDVVPRLLGPSSVYIAMSLFIVIAFRFYDFVWLNLNAHLKRHIGDVLMQRMMQHSSALFQNHFSGNLANKIKEVMSSIPDLLKLSIDKFFAQSLGISLTIFTVWTTSYKFAIALAVWIAIFVSGTVIFSKRARILSQVASEVRSDVVGKIVDILANIMSIRLFAGRFFESKRLKKTLDDYVVADQKRDWYFLKLFTFQGVSFVIYQIVCFVFLINGFQAGRVSPGDFAFILMINISIIDILWGWSEHIGKFAELSGNVIQGLNIVLSPIEIQDKPEATRLKVTRGAITFDHVQFQYKGADPLFEDKSVTIEPGQKVGLVGYSGGGKTTFVNLILRLYDVTKGRILIDGQDIREISQDSLRQVIGMIPQDPFLFHRTLRENIHYGRIEAGEEAVILASKQACAHDFIMSFPKGYESLVGERGVKLSGGQRQRIAIARAILKNAPILILDEATSQLDSVTEQDIQEFLWPLMQGKTTIVIAHRLSTLLHMDRILVFDQGKIVQDGTHADLLLKAGLYKTLWDAQVGGFLPDEKDTNP